MRTVLERILGDDLDGTGIVSAESSGFGPILGWPIGEPQAVDRLFFGNESYRFTATIKYDDEVTPLYAIFFLREEYFIATVVVGEWGSDVLGSFDHMEQIVLEIDQLLIYLLEEYS